MKSMKARVIIILSVFALLTSVVLTMPAATAQAKNSTESLINHQEVSNVVQNVDEKDIEKAKKFVKEALKLNNDFTYSVDRQKALQIGFSVEQVTNMAIFFENLPVEQVKFLESGKQIPIKGDKQIKPMIAPALPWLVYISLQDLIAVLTALGLAGVAKKFLEDIYTYGIKEACKKFSKKHEKIKNFCENNGYPTK
ncbi:MULTISPECIES: hypothetical protein [Bacillaceae]|jgi:hypothetical protein|uniref:Secreted protein n=3 Tax=Bacillaceae TaxID=186817 RepID=A0A090IPE9_9BACI|nr:MULTISPECIES: hypothetical protein [Bacillaceae]AWI10766.1 hypothetical protein CQJ30_00225 [Caldibacillus thermoamylovorans]MCB7068964.1 hypothetical protein [Caldibacillus sp. 210928-DFI.2.22]MCB7072273.1 hypothetical protein [Caldibacillus sp. 210928-DFI.2.18]MCM3055231.1 hypothetical protein [Caldibacillus thermoamylovorans]MCM3478916.1 hypothetical protein [Caldibacillus thermoamylovorans]